MLNNCEKLKEIRVYVDLTSKPKMLKIVPGSFYIIPKYQPSIIHSLWNYWQLFEVWSILLQKCLPFAIQIVRWFKWQSSYSAFRHFSIPSETLGSFILCKKARKNKICLAWSLKPKKIEILNSRFVPYSWRLLQFLTCIFHKMKKRGKANFHFFWRYDIGSDHLSCPILKFLKFFSITAKLYVRNWN